MSTTLAKLVPDRICKIDFSYDCWNHDSCYAVAGTEADRKEADTEFAIDVYQRCIDRGIPDPLASRVADIARGVVDRMGMKYFSYLEGHGPKKKKKLSPPKKNDWWFNDGND